MKLFNQIFSFNSSNSSDYFSTNGTKVETDFEMLLAVYVVGILFGLPINSSLIWLIVRGTGNGLASEIFILNLSVCEILLSLESLLTSLAYKCEILWTLVAFVDGLLVLGRPLFQCLICVERYLAVVHPVTFLKFKPLRYKLMCCAVACLPMLAAGGLSVTIWLFLDDLYVPFLSVPFLILLSIQMFCCLAVLRALKQSGPGERGREKEEENHNKKRAFYLILITTVTTVITYTPYTVIIMVLHATANNETYLCFAYFTYTLAGLVEPVLFLYRVGKLNFIKCK